MAISHIYKDFEKSEKEFKTNYDPKLANDVITDLGLRFSGGLVRLDLRNYDPSLPHQYRPYLYMLNSKTLGYSGIEVVVKDLSNPYWHETVAGAVPQYLLNQLPSGRYTPGKMICKHSYGYDSSGRPFTLIALLPTGGEIGF